MSTTQATHRTRTTALRMCAYIAPLVAQCIMLIALLVRQQWLFALMIDRDVAPPRPPWC